MAESDHVSNGSMSSPLPESVSLLIRHSIKSAWALELLLFMRRSAPRSWTVAELTTELRSNHVLTAGILTNLKTARLVTEAPEGLFRYEPASADLAETVTQLDEINAERPFTLIKQILSAPNDKLTSFVEAFKLKKDKD